MKLSDKWKQQKASHKDIRKHDTNKLKIVNGLKIMELDSPRIDEKRRRLNIVNDNSDNSMHNVLQKLTNTNKGKENLCQWGLPDSIVDAYREKGIVQMFPWQVECLSVRNVLLGGNLVYSAPTSAGKTMIAEILILKRVLEKKQKALFILPFISIAREKMFYLQSLFQNAGIRVDGYMGTHNPAGGFSSVDIAVCTIEKANGLINRLLEEGTLNQLGILVVDELHMVGDSHRGYLLELLLTKVLFASLRNKSEELSTQIVGMSATLPNLDMLALWLKAEFYHTDFRPVPLDEYIKIGNILYHSGQMSKVKELPKYILSTTGKEDTEHSIFLCLETVVAGNSVLVFCPAKQWCEKLAENIAREIYEIGRAKNSNENVSASNFSSNWGPLLRKALNGKHLSDVCEQLRRCSAGLDGVLALTVPFGVAYHHAGLTFDERDIIEGAYRHGYLKVLVATTTLSSGVNLPARRVLIRSPIAHGNSLDVLSYKQMVGRAGRKGVDTLGESILLCKESERSVAMKLAVSLPKPVQSCLVNLKNSVSLSSSLKRAILEVIASGSANTPKDVSTYASCTLLATSLEVEVADNLSHERTKEAVDLCINYLVDNEFIMVQKNDESDEIQYVSSRLGKAVLASSLAPDEALSLLRELKKAHKCFVLENELHLIYQVTPPFLSEQLSSSVNWMEYLTIWDQLPLDMKKVGELVGVEEGFLLSSIRGLNKSQPKVLAVHLRFYAALALHDLVQEVRLARVVEKFKIPRGVLQSLQQSASTFSGMVTAFCNRLGWKNMELLIKQFQHRLHFGVQQELCDLVRLTTLNGQLARILYDGGFETSCALARSNPREIGIILKNAKPFESEKDNQSGNNNQGCYVWITGKKGVNEMQAAEMIIREARYVVEKDLGIQSIDWQSNKEKDNVNSNLFGDQHNLQGGKNEINISHTIDPSNSRITNETNNRCVSAQLRGDKGGISTKELSQQNELILRNSFIISNNIACSDNVTTSSSRQECETTKSVSKERDSFDKPVMAVSNASTPIVNNTIYRFSDTIDLGVDKTSTPCLPIENKIQLTVKTFSKAVSKIAMKQGVPFTKTLKEMSEGKLCTELNNISFKGDEVLNRNEIDDLKYMEFDSSFSILDSQNSNCLRNFNKVPTNQAKITEDCCPSDSEDIFLSPHQLLLNFDSHQNPVKHGSNLNEQFLTINNLKNDKQQSYRTTVQLNKNINEDLSCISEVDEVKLSKEDDLDLGNFKANCKSDQSISIRGDGNLSNESCVPPSQNDVGFDRSLIADIEEMSSFEDSHDTTFPKPRIELFDEKSSQCNKQCSKTQTKTVHMEEILATDTLLKNLNTCDFNDSFNVSEDIPIENNNSFGKESVKSNRSSFPSILSDDSFNSFLVKNDDIGDDIDSIAPTQEETVKASLTSIKNSRDQTFRQTRSKSLLAKSACSFTQTPSDAFSIIDVASSKTLFKTFLDEWKCKNKFSISIACERYSTMNKMKEIGFNIIKETKQDQEECQSDVLVGIAISWGDKDAYYVSLSDSLENKGSDAVSIEFRKYSLLDGLTRNENGETLVSVFDFKNQLNILCRSGYNILPLFNKLVCVDPKIADWLLDPSSKEKSLHSLIINYLPNYADLLKILSGTFGARCIGGTTSNKESGRIRSSLEAVLVFHLMDALTIKLKENHLKESFFKIEMPTLLVLSPMDQCGFGFDPKMGKRQRDRLVEHLDLVEKTAFRLAKRSFNMISPKDVFKVLFKEQRLSSKNCDIKNSNASKRDLMNLKSKHPLPGLILEWRKVSCAINKVLNPLLRECRRCDVLSMHRVYSESQTLTATGRISMKEPNMQNIPRDFEIELIDNNGTFTENEIVSLRNCFIPCKGSVFVSADYSQLELRILAHLSNETKLKMVLNSGEDVFISLSATWLAIPKELVTDKQRQRTKQICYGIIYGMGLKSMAEQLDLEEHEAQNFMESFHKCYPGIQEYTASIIDNCKNNGFVETLFGRRRYLPNTKSLNGSARLAAERQAVNTTIQGSAADIVKKAMIKILSDIQTFVITYKETSFCLKSEDKGPIVKLVLQLHDELIYEVPKTWVEKVSRVIKKNMEGVAPRGIKLPVNLKIGRSWGSLEDSKS